MCIDSPPHSSSTSAFISLMRTSDGGGGARLCPRPSGSACAPSAAPAINQTNNQFSSALLSCIGCLRSQLSVSIAYGAMGSLSKPDLRKLSSTERKWCSASCGGAIRRRPS